MKRNKKTGKFINCGNIIETKCEFCSKPIKSYKSQIRKYCSRKCFAEARIKKKKTFICLNCGKKFVPRRNDKYRDYCSIKCFKAYQTKHNSQLSRFMS